ncbi:MAG TPA: heme ABC exporter ATP-binding protein CcmA [Gemmatimonadaceae bacterium]|nr:heme ABC exporter ATP-binding protein CcmA [Gemmatimonadaceae bacterium]
MSSSATEQSVPSPTPPSQIIAADQVAVDVIGLGRRFGRRVAVRDVSFTLRRGDCLALFGPNGAGKTTLLRVLAGLLRPTSGSARVAGVALPGGATARAVVGLISHQSMLYAALTALENVEFAAKLYGVSAPRDAARRALERMRVADRADSPVRALSRGLQQRVSIARAMVHDPRVVLLDEPYTGLDEAGAAALTDALHTLKREGAALVLVTHHVGEGLAIASHTAIMRDGLFVNYAERGNIAPDAYRDAYRQAVLR